jgi:exosortase A-associated hydrolase 2
MELHPFFLDTDAGRCFALHRTPEGGAKQHVLFVPPFNEEMNRCRSMMAFMAQALADQGMGSLLLDLQGTGESEGGHGDARWESWLRNLDAAVAWLEQRGECVALLGVRLGAVLAADWMRSAPGRVQRLLMWQPVLDGQTFMTQFLRVKIAANMDRSDLPKETTQGMREQWARGESVEVAGYEMHPDLACAIDARKLPALVPPAGTQVHWFSHFNAATNGATPADLKAIEAWKQAGAHVQAAVFNGEAFWQVHQRASAPELIELSRKALQS